MERINKDIIDIKIRDFEENDIKPGNIFLALSPKARYIIYKTFGLFLLNSYYGNNGYCLTGRKGIKNGVKDAIRLSGLDENSPNITEQLNSKTIRSFDYIMNHYYDLVEEINSLSILQCVTGKDNDFCFNVQGFCYGSDLSFACLCREKNINGDIEEIRKSLCGKIQDEDVILIY